MLFHRKKDVNYTCFINDAPTGDGLHIIELGFSHPKPCTVGPRIRRHTLMHFVFQGEGRFNGQTLTAGQGFLVQSDHLHTFSVESSPWIHCWVAFQGEGTLLQRMGLQGDRIFSFRPDPTLLQYLTALTAPENSEQINECALLSVFYRLLSLIEDCRPFSGLKKGDYVEAALALIHSRFNEPLRIADIARQLNLSEGYLWRIFRREMGCSPLQYLERVRLDEAKRLLLETTLSATEIAASTGYAGAAPFFRQFKSVTGQTPLQYRKNGRTV